MIAATHTKFSEMSGGRPDCQVRVKGSEVIKKGDLLTVHTDGSVKQALALPGSNNSATTSGGSTPVTHYACESFTADANGTSTDGLGRTRLTTVVIDDTFRWETRTYDGTATSTQQDDTVEGTNYQYQRWRGASATDWWYEMIITTTNGEWIKQKRSPNSLVTDNYGANIYKPALLEAIRYMG